MALTSTSDNYLDADFYSSVAGHIRAWVKTQKVSESTTQVVIRYIFGLDQSQSYSDSQDFYASIDGVIQYDETLTNSKGSGSYIFYQVDKTYNKPAYGSSSVDHEARAQVSGIYDGPTANTGTQSTDTNVPAKAGVVPTAPTGLTNSGKTSSSLSFTWGDPNMSGLGPNIDSVWVQVATGADMSGLIANGEIGNVNAYTQTGLAKASTYYTRVRAHNSVGWGAWTNPLGATTLATVPDTMAAPTLSNATTNGFNVNFSAPGNGGSAITSYEIQVSRDDFATVEATFTGVTSSPKTLNTLAPGVTYKARVRAVNAVGGGSWSAASGPIQTLGGVKIRNDANTAWIEGIVRCWDAGTSSWKVAIVRKWNGSSWVV